eukprot:5987140-Prymnesium_polylepis.1
MRALRAVMLAKDDTGVNYRLLPRRQLPPARCGCAIVATIKKAAWNKFYTSELTDVKERASPTPP